MTYYLFHLLGWFRAGWETAFPNNLDLYLKDLKLLVSAITGLQLVASCFE